MMRSERKSAAQAAATPCSSAATSPSLFQLGFGVGMIAYADMPETAKEDILGRNALQLLERTQWFERGMVRK